MPRSCKNMRISWLCTVLAEFKHSGMVLAELVWKAFHRTVAHCDIGARLDDCKNMETQVTDNNVRNS